jgi:Ala-tRNA(Pro) deacylase
MVVRAVLCSKGRGFASVGAGASAGVSGGGISRHLVANRQSIPPPVPASRQDLFARLADLGIATQTIDHPAVFTVAESSKLERELPGGHTKNLFLKDKRGALFLVVALGRAHIDLKTLHRKLGCDRLSFGKPELLMEVLGVPAGSVTPFALINDKARRVTVILDADMMRHEQLNYHPLENTATTNIAREDLLRFIRSCGHEPRIMAVASAQDNDIED